MFWSAHHCAKKTSQAVVTLKDSKGETWTDCEVYVEREAVVLHREIGMAELNSVIMLP